MLCSDTRPFDLQKEIVKTNSTGKIPNIKELVFINIVKHFEQDQSTLIVKLTCFYIINIAKIHKQTRLSSQMVGQNTL